MRNEPRPLIAAAEALFVEPDCNAAVVKLCSQRYRIGLVTVFVTEEGNGSIIAKLHQTSIASRKRSGLSLKIAAQFPYKIKPRQILEIDTMTLPKEESCLRLLRILKEIGILQCERGDFMIEGFKYVQKNAQVPLAEADASMFVQA